MATQTDIEGVAAGVLEVPAAVDAEMPYPGLRHFQERDRRFFFGRKTERETIIASLFSGPLTVYYGASGVGKTSLLLADVIPYLKGLKEKPSGINAKRFNRVAVVLFRNWAVPDFQLVLRDTVIKAIETSPMAPLDFRKELPAIEAKIHRPPNVQDKDGKESRPFATFLRACCQLFEGNIFLFFDQFEEYFRYHHPSADPMHFDRQFAGILNSADLPVSVLVSMREEGLAKLDRFQFSVPNILRNLMRIRDLDENSARAAIKEPLAVFNSDKPPEMQVEIEEELVESLVAEVVPRMGDQDESCDNPPLRQKRRYRGAAYLQMLLESAWHQLRASGQRVLSVDTVIEASKTFVEPREGGEEETQRRREEPTDFASCARRIAEGYVRQLIEAKLDEVWSRLPQVERDAHKPVNPERVREIASRVFPFMVTPGGAKMAQSVDTLLGYATAAATESEKIRMSPEEVDLTMQLLSKTGLIRLVGTNKSPGQNIYEVAHDVLGVATDKWREEYQRNAAARKAREEAEREEERKRESERKRLDQELATRRAEVETKRAEVEKHRAQVERRRKWGFAALASVALVLLLCAVVFIGEQKKVQDQLTKRSEALVQKQKELEQLQIQTRKERDDIKAEAESGLRSGQYIRAAETAMQLVGYRERPPTYVIPQTVAMSSIPRGLDKERKLASPRALLALRFVTDNSLEQVSLWQDDDIQKALGKYEKYLPFAQSPDGNLVITIESAEDGRSTPVVWDTVKLYERKHMLGPLTGEDARLVAMAFSSDSKSFVARSKNQKVWLWDVDAASAPPQLLSPDQAKDVLSKARVKTLPETGDKKNPWFHPYTKVRDRWILDSLSNLTGASAAETSPGEATYLKSILPPGLEPFDGSKVKRIQEAFNTVETDIEKSKAELSEALKDIMAVNPDDAGEALALGLMRRGSEAALNGDEAKAIALYEKAKALREDLKTINPKAEARKWANLTNFNRLFEQGRQDSEDGNRESAQKHFKEAKSLDVEQWAKAYEASMKTVAELPPDGAPSPGPSNATTGDERADVERLIDAVRKISLVRTAKEARPEESAIPNK